MPRGISAEGLSANITASRIILLRLHGNLSGADVHTTGEDPKPGVRFGVPKPKAVEGQQDKHEGSRVELNDFGVEVRHCWPKIGRKQDQSPRKG